MINFPFPGNLRPDCTQLPLHSLRLVGRPYAGNVPFRRESLRLLRHKPTNPCCPEALAPVVALPEECPQRGTGRVWPVGAATCSHQLLPIHCGWNEWPAEKHTAEDNFAQHGMNGGMAPKFNANEYFTPKIWCQQLPNSLQIALLQPNLVFFHLVLLTPPELAICNLHKNFDASWYR